MNTEHDEHSEYTPLLNTTPPTPRRAFRAVGALGAAVVLLLVTAVYIQIYRAGVRGTTSLEAPTMFSDASPVLLAVGDWGRGGIEPQRAVADALERTASSNTTRSVVLSTGDNFYDRGVRGVHDQQWNESYEGVYGSLPALSRTPFLPVLGNHDHKGDALAQIRYTKRSSTWDLSARYSARLISPGLLLVRVDTTPYVHDKAGRTARARGWHPKEQTKWLARVLAEAERNKNYVLVVGHHNFYTASTCGHYGTKRVRNSLEPILRRHRRWILAYVCGHEHSLMHMRKHGIDHILSGGGSLLDPICRPKKMNGNLREKGILPDKQVLFANSTNGFYKLHFDRDSGVFTANAVDAQSNVIYSFTKHFKTP